MKMTRQPLSLDQPVGDHDDSFFGEFVEDHREDDPLQDMTQDMLKQRIADVLAELNYREREILRLRYGLADGYSYTLEEVGKIFSVTRERVRQIEAKAVRKLQHPILRTRLEWVSSTKWKSREAAARPGGDWRSARASPGIHPRREQMTNAKCKMQNRSIGDAILHCAFCIVARCCIPHFVWPASCIVAVTALAPVRRVRPRRRPCGECATRWSTNAWWRPASRTQRVIQAMRDTKRHEFVLDPQQRKQAYFDMAMPIGEGQTISPPFIVAYMTEQLDPQPTDKVLEIGTGSGYQAAVLSGAGRGSLLDRDRRDARQARGRDAPTAGLQERPHEDRRRLPGLARTRAVRQDHRHLLAGERPAAAVDQLKEGGPDGRSPRASGTSRCCTCSRRSTAS